MRALWTSPAIPSVTRESRPMELLFTSNPIFTDALVSLSPVSYCDHPSAYFARRQPRWPVLHFTTMFVSQSGFSRLLFADAITAPVDVIIITLFSSVVTLSKKAVCPKQVLWHVLSPRRSDLSPDPDSHRLHDQFDMDDIANLHNLTSALPGAHPLTVYCLQLKGARLSDQIESQHYFFSR
jgi:hypothetical protein